MRLVPVDLPVTGRVTGEQYTKYTNLCSITLPNDDLKDYCIVEMNRKVASHILHEDIRYATIVDSISRKLRSKYSIRIYWMVMLYAYNGGVTFRFDEFKKQICGSEDKYDRYPHFEAEVLSKAKRDIDTLYEQGLCEYSFEYHPTKEDREKSKEKGNPETIVFTITKNKDHRLEVKEVEENPQDAQIKEIEKILLEEFGIGRNRIKNITSRITDDNIEALREKITKLQTIRKEDSTKGGGFYATSILNFFDECKPPVVAQEETQDKESADNKESGETAGTNVKEAEKHDQKYWRNQWYNCQKELEEIGYNIEKSDAKQAFRYLVHKLKAFLRMRHFASFEHDRDFQLAAFLQKLYSVCDLEIVVMRINIQTELDLLHFLCLIMLLLIFQLLLLFIQKFAEIHNTAHRRNASFRHHDQIKTRIFCLLARRTKFQSPQLLSVRSNYEQIHVSIGPIIIFQQLSDCRILPVKFPLCCQPKKDTSSCLSEFWLVYNIAR